MGVCSQGLRWTARRAALRRRLQRRLAEVATYVDQQLEDMRMRLGEALWVLIRMHAYEPHTKTTKTHTGALGGDQLGGDDANSGSSSSEELLLRTPGRQARDEHQASGQLLPVP